MSTLLVIFVALKFLFGFSLSETPQTVFNSTYIITLDVLWVVKSFFCDYMAIKYVLLSNF